MSATDDPAPTLRYRVDASQATAETSLRCDVSTTQRTDMSFDTKEATIDELKKGTSGKIISCKDDKEKDSLECHAKWELCDFHSLPHWLQDNEYLFKSHRPPLHSYSACFWSIFRIHSQTGNIWSHLIACVFFIVLGIKFVTDPSIAVPDKLLMAPYYIGAICCLGFSSIYHTVHCCSHYAEITFSRLDYCGISLLIMGSMFTYLYYNFYCHFWSRTIYISAVMVLGSGTIAISLFEKFSIPEYRVFRALIFSILGLSGLIPCLHFYTMMGWSRLFSEDKLILIQAILYILGAALYAYRFPECYFLGKCDIWFQSHQIFHILVVIATLTNYFGIQQILQKLDSMTNCN